MAPPLVHNHLGPVAAIPAPRAPLPVPVMLPVHCSRVLALATSLPRSGSLDQTRIARTPRRTEAPVRLPSVQGATRGPPLCCRALPPAALPTRSAALRRAPARLLPLRRGRRRRAALAPRRLPRSLLASPGRTDGWARASCSAPPRQYSLLPPQATCLPAHPEGPVPHPARRSLQSTPPPQPPKSNP